MHVLTVARRRSPSPLPSGRSRPIRAVDSGRSAPCGFQQFSAICDRSSGPYSRCTPGLDAFICIHFGAPGCLNLSSSGPPLAPPDPRARARIARECRRVAMIRAVAPLHDHNPEGRPKKRERRCAPWAPPARRSRDQGSMMGDEHTTRNPTMRLRLYGKNQKRSAHRALSRS